MYDYPDKMNDLCIFTCNVRGLGNFNKRRQFFHYLNINKCDTAFIQETHSTKKCERLWKSQYGGQIIYSHGESNARGVAILINKRLSTKIYHTIKDSQGLFLILDVAIAGHRITLINVYGPNSDDPEFLQNVVTQAQQVPNIETIVAGDFNTLINANKKRRGPPTHPKSSKKLAQIVEHLDLVDIWRVLNPNDFKFTWKKAKPRIIMERIDYIFVSTTLAKITTKATILPSFKSDHSFPQITLKLVEEKKGPGYWKMNTSHLNNDDYQKEIITILTECATKYNDVFMRWEIMKMSVRGYSLKYGARKTKSNTLKLQALTMKKAQIEKQQAVLQNGQLDSNLFTDHESQICQIEKDIDEIMQQKTEAAMLRCREQFYDGGEKCTLYFFNLEKRKANKKVIKALKTSKGNTTYNSRIILKELESFYSKLFTSNGMTPTEEYLGNIEMPKISNSDRTFLDSPITLSVIKIAIKQLAVDKCPGLDGIPIEFYQKFEEHILPTLHSVYMKAINLKEFHRSATQGILSLLEKPDKNLLSIASWHPLVMLNVDFKIYSKTITNRLQSVLPELIHPDQKGFMKGRKISHNILELQSLIQYCDINDIEAYLMAIDFLKAFDRVEWIAFEHVLRMCNFGQQFIDYYNLCL